MQLKYEFIMKEIADKTFAVTVREDIKNFNGYIKMNDIGAYIFNMLKNDVTEDDIIAAMIKDYPDNTEAEIKEAVSGFIAGLKESDLLI